MLIRPSNAVIALVVVLVGLLLATMIPYGSKSHVAFAQDSSIPYAENATIPVATFTADDQDGHLIEWDLAESEDYKLFTIVGGVLAFIKSPNYEEPNSKSTGTLADRNAYNVTIEATGGSHDVTVNVTNVDEDGKVTLTKPQPQIGRGLVAELEDPDGGETDEKWQWARSEDGETWADIEGATSQSRNPTGDDAGSFLRATVNYADSFGNGKTAMAVSENRVEARTVANAAPSFSDQDRDDETPYVDVSRSVGENTDVGGNVGKPVSATDTDGDVLLYSLRITPDLNDDEKDRFTIDPRSGQIKVGKKLGADPAVTGTTEEREDEAATGFTALSDVPEVGTPGVDPRVENNSMYVLIVRATDPSGAYKDVNVVVTVTELPEAPAFDDGAPMTLWVTEGTGRALRTGKTVTTDPDNALGTAAYVATDDDGESITYSVVEPDDEDFFSIDGSDAELTINATHTPNFEEQASYPITIVASSGDDDDARTTRLSVTVRVADAEDDGEVKLSQLEPQVGGTVVASLTDPDGGETVSAWQWYRDVPADTTDVTTLTGVAECDANTAADAICAIPKAKSAAYTPTDDDNGGRLAALATYTDNIDSSVEEGTDTAEVFKVTREAVQRSEPDNTAPLFPDQDPNTSGDQSDETSRSVAENTEAKQSIGAPVAAGDENGDAVLYTLGGADADSFSIDRATGQISTKAELDYETKDTYTVVVTATDPSGAADSILVTINVTDEDDVAEIAGPSAFVHAENATIPVATFTADDQDGHLIEWDLAESEDYKLFTIVGGVLAFIKSPNYEEPNSKSTGTLADRNAYNVTIEATGGSHDVTVNVTNVDEDGKVTLTKPQPQIGRGLVAELEDPDGGETDEKWQWARSEDGETWADIEGATSQSRNPTGDDAGSFLRATVNYADSFGNGKTAMAVSENRVEARTVANAAPSFSDQDRDDETPYVDVSRSVGENTDVGGNVGKPVSATDTDGDVLLYSLRITPDLNDDEKDRFTIDPRSGQIKVGKKLGADPAVTGTTEEREDEAATGFTALSDVPEVGTPGVDPRVENNSMYVLIVRATDPSGAYKDVNVVVTVTELPEAPAFDDGAPMTLWVTEGTGRALRTGKTVTTDPDNALGTAAYVATDDDGESITYSVVEPDDEDFFSIDGSDAELTINATHTPNFEEQASYPITIVASSGDDDDARTTRLSVTVKVTDAEDDGEVKLSQLEPQVGRTIVASLTDPDGGETVSAWQWYRDVPADTTDVTTLTGAAECDANTAADAICAIPKAKSAAYTPTDDDNGGRLAALATYTDNIDSSVEEGTDTAEVFKVTREAVQQSEADNTAPLFPDQDPNTSGDQSDETSRSVAENTEAKQSIGAPVGAGDEDGDARLYTLGGADADSFSIDRATGQISTKAELDYETKDTYTVVVTATDPSGAADSILVTINVTDEDDGATIQLNVAPAFADDSADRSVAENSAAGTAVGDPVTATDANAGDTLTYTLGGDDADSFDIDGSSGQLSTKAELDYETKASYSVTVTATDSGEASDSIAVTISVTNVNEAPAFASDEAGREVAENTAAGEAIGDAVTAADEDADDTLTYTLGGDDAESFDIDGSSGQLSTKAELDYETKSSYAVTVTATDSGEASDSIAVTISVTDVNEAPAFAADEAGREVAENTAAGEAIGDAVTADDVDADDTLAYSLGGDDADSFDIDGSSGQLSTKAELDYETKASYSVTVTATDLAGDSDSIAVTISVTDVNEAPAFAADEAALEVAENTAAGEAIGDAVTAADEDADDTLTYTLGGDDADSFDIDGSSGQLSTKAELDYETKSSYSVTVTATDSGEASDSIAVTISVTDVNEAPAFAADEAALEVAENTAAGEAIGDAVTAADEDADDTLTYTLGGDDADSFDIDGSSGQLSTKAELDYETKASYMVTVTATDSGEASDSIAVTISVTDVNEAPAFAADEAALEVAENTAAGEAIGDAVTAADEDADDTLTYTLGGDDADSFDIDGSSGQLSTKAELDYETKASYSVTVTATDSGEASDSIAVTISVTDVNEAPAFAADEAALEVAENTAAGEAIGDAVTAADEDADDTLTYTLGGDDADSFDIDGSSGQLSTKAELDYETKAAMR